MLLPTLVVVSEARKHSFHVLQYLVYDFRCVFFVQAGIESDAGESYAEEPEFLSNSFRSLAPQELRIVTSDGGSLSLQPMFYLLQGLYGPRKAFPKLMKDAHQHRRQIVCGHLVALNDIGQSLIDYDKMPISSTPLRDTVPPLTVLHAPPLGSIEKRLVANHLQIRGQ